MQTPLYTPFAMKGNIQGSVVSVRDTSNDNRPSGSSTDDEIVRTNALSTGANPTYFAANLNAGKTRDS